MNINYDTLPDLAGADGFAIDILALDPVIAKNP